MTVNAESLTVYDLEHEPYIFGNNFRLRGRSALFLVSLDSCVHQDTPKTNFVSERVSSVHEPSILLKAL